MQVLLSVKEETPLNDTEVDTLKNVVLLKDGMISELNATVRALEEKLNEAMTKYEDCRESRTVLREEVAFLREQIRGKDEYIKYLVN